MAKVKRPDIQGIRGLAIVSVLAFHLKEQQFPAGFIGVDVFFVLSGYLMSSILAKEKSITIQVLFDFYIRRFKRIVPLYSILLLALFLLVPLLLLSRDVGKFLTDSKWAAIFATNRHSMKKRTDYFAELYDSNVLTHTWSLGVEIQYYFIVPFILLLQRLLGRKLAMPYLIFLSAGSFYYQSSSSAAISFNALSSRVWQFIAGGIAHEIITLSSHAQSLHETGTKVYASLPASEITVVMKTETNDESRVRETMNVKEESAERRLIMRSLSIIISIVLFILALSPVQILSNQTLRATVIVLTSAIIVLGKEVKHQSRFLSNRLIVYFGDISYVVYLVHWPVVVMWKSYWDIIDLACTDIIICIVITLLISTFVHHTLEQLFINTSTEVALVVVGVVYLFMFCAVRFHIPQRLNVAMEAQIPVDLASAIKWNQMESHPPTYRERPFKECEDDPEGLEMRDGYSAQPVYECLWKPAHPSAKVRILVLGNSISHRATKILRPILENNVEVKEMRLFAQSACRPLLNNCPEFFDAMMKLVKRMQPDITFFIYDDSEHLRRSISNIATDEPLARFVDFLKPLSANSKFLVIDEFYPAARTPTGVAPSMYKRLLRRHRVDDLKGRLKAFNDIHSSYFRRLDQLQSHFPNLIRHNTSAPLCAEQKGWCWWYNRRNLHAYFTDNAHFTPDGLELQRASYKKIVDELIPALKNRNNTVIH
ncbi:hypothetical protein PRIPAC_80063 [Pristionchus pacificus]|uniref:Acyltransferase n=1 Tax=Pristionchus pacificus TaxID=54126 RepID=A0A2A6CNI7_PRIPA|nr:hypothetical protein PRIPAC_80063 [Pristionchus pacificus]|eukprot:PDM79785.1 Acyltransferase [Pristionchus pacificus]